MSTRKTITWAVQVAFREYPNEGWTHNADDVFETRAEAEENLKESEAYYSKRNPYGAHFRLVRITTTERTEVVARKK